MLQHANSSAVLYIDNIHIERIQQKLKRRNNTEGEKRHIYTEREIVRKGKDHARTTSKAVQRLTPTGRVLAKQVLCY